jgi:hypothetical protein
MNKLLLVLCVILPSVQRTEAVDKTRVTNGFKSKCVSVTTNQSDLDNKFCDEHDLNVSWTKYQTNRPKIARLNVRLSANIQNVWVCVGTAMPSS